MREKDGEAECMVLSVRKYVCAYECVCVSACVCVPNCR